MKTQQGSRFKPQGFQTTDIIYQGYDQHSFVGFTLLDLILDFKCWIFCDPIVGFHFHVCQTDSDRTTLVGRCSFTASAKVVTNVTALFTISTPDGQTCRKFVAHIHTPVRWPHNLPTSSMFQLSATDFHNILQCAEG